MISYVGSHFYAFTGTLSLFFMEFEFASKCLLLKCKAKFAADNILIFVLFCFFVVYFIENKSQHFM